MWILLFVIFNRLFYLNNTKFLFCNFDRNCFNFIFVGSKFNHLLGNCFYFVEILFHFVRHFLIVIIWLSRKIKLLILLIFWVIFRRYDILLLLIFQIVQLNHFYLVHYFSISRFSHIYWIKNKMRTTNEI